MLWTGENIGVTAGEDGLVKYVVFTFSRFVVMLNNVSSRWWDLRTRETINVVKFQSPITSMEHSVQTERIVLTSGRTVSFIPATPSTVPTHNVELAYSPSAASLHPVLQDRFVTGSSGDEWVRVHGTDGEEREVLKGHHGPVHCIEFSPDGEMFASGSGKFIVLLEAPI